MEDLLLNIYGDTCRKIVKDLLKQIEDYESSKDPLDKLKRKNLIKIVKKPIEIYNEYHALKGFNEFEMPKL